MDDKAQRVHKIQVALAEKGSVFSSEEIDDILTILDEVSLKLIITNVPQEVYKYDAAKEAFESLFKSFDCSCRFVYLPSFRRALIYVTRPEAALLARLQTQGWKLPQSILATIPSDSVTSNTDGINCYIAHFGDSSDSNDEQGDEECDCFEHTCDASDLVMDNNGSDEWDDSISSKPSCDLKGTSSVGSGNIGVFLSRISSDISHSTVSDIPSPLTVLASTASSTGNSSTPKDVSIERSICTPECENTSEASGDDGTSVRSQSTHVCCRKGKRKLSKKCSRMKHLAPPKPSRLFLLSPPASPPVGWEPKPESEPVINYDLLQALAALAPGEAFELHPSDQINQHPSIVVTPCQYETTDATGQRFQIVQTRCPDRKI